MKPHQLDELWREVQVSPFLAGYADGCTRFADLPIIGRAELRELVERNFDLRRETTGVYLLRTGGTLAEALIVPLGIDENRQQRQAMADHLRRAGVFTPTTVAVNLFNYKHLYRSASIFDDFLERCDATSIGLGAITPDEFVVNFCHRLHPDTVVGTPSRLYQLAAHVSEAGVDLRLPRAVFGGEVMSVEYLTELRAALGLERLFGVYASVENGSWGYCDHDRDGPLYRVVEEIVHVEIEDPDEHGVGNLVVTNTMKRRFPVLRYRNGDRGRLVERDGRRYVDLAGRGAYTFRVNHRAMTEADFAPVVGGATSYQIQLSLTAERRTRVDVLVVPASAPTAGELDAKRRTLATVLNGVDVDRDVRFVTPRELQTSPTTNKTPAVVDTRQATRW
jgi:phenylacetate-CoA ligase